VGLFSDVVERAREGQVSFPASMNGPTLSDLLLSLSKAMDLLEGKSLRSGMKTAVLAGSIARIMGLSNRESGAIVYAALLHDIGLASVVADLYPHLPPGLSEKVLFQNHALLNARVIGSPHERPLSEDLHKHLERHPAYSASFVASIGLSSDVSDLVAAHHELYDGSGYPAGLAKEQIPLGARILAFADVVEGVLDTAAKEASGLTSRRYAVESFLEIKAPGKFDPEIVAIFKSLLNDYEDFLRHLSSLEVEFMVRQLLPERSTPMDGHTLYRVALAMGNLSDGLMPLHKKGRSWQVADLASRLAESLGIGREQCGELVIAALLMDIGHLATPAHILFKVNPLNSEERGIIHDHPHLTHEVLKNIPGFENIGLWASEHHERINGKGYPHQRKGYEISVGGRILALADVFNALTSQRPYRTHAHAPMDAIPVIGQGRMTLYDNALVTQLRRVVLEREIGALQPQS
jgi:HD-GYP domain-containing protein (c-di-GMP phosphodiesterase class II)